MATSLSTKELARLATGREDSLFASDLLNRAQELVERLGGARVLVIGGAGSIGSSTVRQMLRFSPSAIHVVDISENNLAELVRDLRGGEQPMPIQDFRTIVLDYGSPVMHRLLQEEPRYDYVLNFAAVKHVRSEKDVYSILQMVDTNILKQARLLGWLDETQPSVRYFSVSTDKAANPVNLMGATKRFMEHVMFQPAPGRHRRAVSARFANVAFSDGSLLHGWIQRLAKAQPMAVPTSTRRYFISLEESGQLCMLASVFGQHGQVFIPKLDPAVDLVELDVIARAFLAAQNLTAREYSDERSAAAAVATDLAEGRYPLVLTTLNTSGEKPYEEFVGCGEKVIEVGMEHLQAIDYVAPPVGSVDSVLRAAEDAILRPSVAFGKQALVAALKVVIPKFQHVETGRSLDERL
jgi:FlaA1/EpsC-like NDP-sugar epimerase